MIYLHATRRHPRVQSINWLSRHLIFIPIPQLRNWHEFIKNEGIMKGLGQAIVTENILPNIHRLIGYTPELFGSLIMRVNSLFVLLLFTEM